MDKTGWQCPVCGGGVAPGVERCPCVVLKRYTISIGGGGAGGVCWLPGTSGKDVKPEDTRFMGATFSPGGVGDPIGRYSASVGMDGRGHPTPTDEQIEQYIQAADSELGPTCTYAWVETLRRYLRAFHPTKPVPSDDGWIEWKGYGVDPARPFPGNVRVTVRTSSGDEATGNANMFV